MSVSNPSSADSAPPGVKDLTADHPTLPPLREAGQAAIDALRRGETHYVPVPGIDPLREALATWLDMYAGGVDKKQIVITNGDQEARFMGLQIAARVDGPVAVPDVAHPGVVAALAISQRRVTRIKSGLSTGFLPSLAAVDEALAGGTKTLYLESPVRLTGAMYNTEQVRVIAEMLRTHGATAVWDQSLAPAVDGEYNSLTTEAPERTLALGTLCPGIGLESWSLGYLHAPLDQVGDVVKLKQMIGICTSAPAQWAAVGATRAYEKAYAILKREMAQARRAAEEVLAGTSKLLSSSTVSLMAFGLAEAVEEAHARLARAGFLSQSGDSFGAPGVLRMTVDPGADMTGAIRTLSEGGTS